MNGTISCPPDAALGHLGTSAGDSSAGDSSGPGDGIGSGSCSGLEKWSCSERAPGWRCGGRVICC